MKIKTNVRAGYYDRCGGYTRCGGQHPLRRRSLRRRTLQAY
jgi:hypothetical protein